MPDDTMRAIRYHNYGGPEQLEFEQVPRPPVQPGTVQVQVKSTSVNPMDWKLRSGIYRQFMPAQFPVTPGLEFAGVVEQVGPGVTGFQKGDSVYGSAQGANAEYVVVPATTIAPKPASLSFDQAAAVPIGALTAWRALDRAQVQPGQRVIVLGAAGGVGGFAVQLARVRGARVIGTTSSKNLDYVLSLGAESAIDYQATPVESVVHDADIIIDTVGGDTGVHALASLRSGGTFIEVAGQPPQEQAQARGIRADSVGRSDPTSTGVLLSEISRLIDAGKIKVLVTNILPLSEVRRAHALSETGHGRGRLVLHVAD